MLESREGVADPPPILARTVALRKMRAEEVENGTVSLAEVAPSEPVEQKDLRVPERRVETYAEHVLDPSRPKRSSSL